MEMWLSIRGEVKNAAFNTSSRSFARSQCASAFVMRELLFKRAASNRRTLQLLLFVVFQYSLRETVSKNVYNKPTTRGAYQTRRFHSSFKIFPSVFKQILRNSEPSILLHICLEVKAV